MSAEAVFEVSDRVGIQKDLDYAEGVYRLAMAIGVQNEADFETLVFEIYNGVASVFPDTLPSESAMQMAHEQIMAKFARRAGGAALSVVEKPTDIEAPNEKKWIVPC